MPLAGRELGSVVLAAQALGCVFQPVVDGDVDVACNDVGGSRLSALALFVLVLWQPQSSVPIKNDPTQAIPGILPIAIPSCAIEDAGRHAFLLARRRHGHGSIDLLQQSGGTLAIKPS